ncbi:unnamed protein product [Orchesella dallaii]|uniref:C2H2-type domain-containing protein n=1 Tax=Orchesella dallaii TaxID=48710 RepID=A0ABP1S1J5_9HEXA
MGFTLKSKFESHLKTFHFKENKQQQGGYSCSECGVTYSLKTHWSRHINDRQRQKSYQCAKCNRVFKRKKYFDNHLKNHGKERTLVCPKCNKGFQVLDVLRKHMQTHTNERNFSYDKCEKTFKTKKELTQHRLIHGERKLKCQLCNASFDKKSQFTLHMNRHEKRLKQKESGVGKASPTNRDPNGNENIGIEMGESITPQAAVSVVLEAKIPPLITQYQELEDYVRDHG